MSYETELNGLDQTRLEHLNAEYVRAFMSSDVNWYEEHLVDDFVCIESDGSILNKSQFLSKTAEGPDVRLRTAKSECPYLRGRCPCAGDRLVD